MKKKPLDGRSQTTPTGTKRDPNIIVEIDVLPGQGTVLVGILLPARHALQFAKMLEKAAKQAARRK